MSDFIDKLKESYDSTRGQQRFNVRTGVKHRQRDRKKSTTDLTDQRFGRLTAKYLTDYPFGVFDNSTTWWMCECDCGCQHPVSSSSLMSGATKSCGCLHSEISSQVIRRNNRKRAKKFEYKGEMLTISELSEISGLHPNTLRYRLKKKGVSAEEAMGKKARPKQLELQLWG